MKSKLENICLVSSIPFTIFFFTKLIEKLREDGITVDIAASDEPQLYELRDRYGCGVFPVSIARQITPFKDIVSVVKLWKYFRNQKYNIVHTHTPKGGLIGMMAAFLARIPARVYTIHGLPLETATGLKRRLLWMAEALSCKLSTHVLAVSPSLRTLVIKQHLCPENKVRVLGNGTACGIDLERFDLSDEVKSCGKVIRDELDICDDAIVFGYVGRLVPDKGIEVLIESFIHLKQMGKDVRLLLIGDFDEVREVIRPEIKESIKNDQWIFWMGHQDPVPYYAAMNIFVMPTRREGFGLTNIEAGAMKLPVISCRVTGCVDAVAENQTGLLVEVDNTGQLTEAMLKLVDKPDLREKLGVQGCQRTKDLYDSERLVREYISFYDNIA